MSKIKITELQEHSLAQKLIHQHNIGGNFRDAADVENAKYHAMVTLSTIRSFIEDGEWTKEELLEYVNSSIEGLKLFNAKK